MMKTETRRSDTTELTADVIADVEPGDIREVERPTAASSPRGQMAITVTFRGVALATLIVVLTAAVAITSWLYFDIRRDMDTQTRRLADNAHAEKVALDYAGNAAAMNFQDLKGWRARLVAGTSPELNDKLTKAATQMEQILMPLQWNSTAQPLTAKVSSTANGVYVVEAFVSVQTKTVQAPQPLQSTATYSVTVDSTKNWQITDVGGIGAVVGQK